MNNLIVLAKKRPSRIVSEGPVFVFEYKLSRKLFPRRETHPAKSRAF